MIGGRRAADWVAEAGDTPLFVYDMAAVSAWIARLRAAMPEGLDVHYAVKANPFGPLLAGIAPLVDGLDIASAGERSEEHTSELQSLMRISYAVFCLNKKKTQKEKKKK